MFLFSKKFIISYKKLKKTNILNSKNKLLSIKNQKNKHPLKSNLNLLVLALPTHFI